MKSRIVTLSAAVLLTGGAFVASTCWDCSPESRYQVVEEGMTRKAQLADEAQKLNKLRTANQVTGEINPQWIAEAEKQLERISYSGDRSVGMLWEEMGPTNIGGRTRTLLVDRNNSNRVYAGSVGGGLYVSENGGGQWQPINDLAPSLLISSMAQAPNGDIYVGTGCSFEGSSDGPGGGIYKSTDGGATFNLIQSTIPSDPNSNSSAIEFLNVNDITVDPNNSSNVFAATQRGLRMSTDGGQTWANPIFVDIPNCNLEATGEAQDLEWANNDRLLVVIGGGLFYSDNPTQGCTYEKADAQVLPASSQRMMVCAAKSNLDHIYSITVNGGQLGNVYESLDNGASWQVLNPGPPVLDPDFNLFGDNGQGYYDLALCVDPQNEERIFIAGVQIYRFDGNWTRAAGEFLNVFSPYYVHSDKHFMTYDPNNPMVMYITHDGGITKSFDAGETFISANRGYVTTQFYGISYDRFGNVAGGTQDNGTKGIFPSLQGQEKDGQDLIGGDGFDTEISQINDAVFGTLYFADLKRSNNFSGFADISTQFIGSGPFNTVIRLWESKNDLTSQDSIEFVVDTTEAGVDVGNGTKRQFTGTITPIQPAGGIVIGSVSLVAGTDILTDTDGDGVIDGSGPGSGTITYNQTTGTADFDVTFDDPPSVNLIVEAHFTTSFSAGDTLFFESNTGNVPIEHVLTTNLAPGDEVKVQDPVQSLMALGTNSAVWVTRDALKYSVQPEWINVTPTPYSGVATCMEFSPDGDIMYVGTRGGSVYRVTGLNDVYEGNTNTTTVTRILNSGQFVTGMSIHPSNSQILVVTLGNWGNDHHVLLFDDAATRSTAYNSTSMTQISIQGNLPGMPVYDAQIDVNNPNIALIGTAYGVYSTNNLFAPTPVWTDENQNAGGQLARVQVDDVRQQRLPYFEAANSGMYYLGTHGRGIWRSGTLVNTPEVYGSTEAPGFVTDLTVYPNPMNGQGFVRVDMSGDHLAGLQIIDLQGRLVRNEQVQLTHGTNNIPVSVDDLSRGTYFVILNTNSDRKVAKLVVDK